MAGEISQTVAINNFVDSPAQILPVVSDEPTQAIQNLVETTQAVREISPRAESLSPTQPLEADSSPCPSPSAIEKATKSAKEGFSTDVDSKSVAV